MPARLTTVVEVAAVALLAACGGDGTAAPHTAGVSVVAARSGTDTIQSMPFELGIAVRGEGGKSAPEGTVVVVEAPEGATADPYSRRVFACVVATTTCGSLVTATSRSDLSTSVTTDASGHASAFVRFGAVAGPTYVIVRVPSLALRDSVPLEAKPGNAFTLRIAPSDTAVVLGASFAVNGAVVDRMDNVRAEPVEITGTSAGLRAAAGTVSGIAYGPQQLFAAGAGLKWTVLVSVVPAGTIAATVEGGGVVLTSTDGASRRFIPLPAGFTVPKGGSTIGAPAGHTPAWWQGNVAFVAESALVARLLLGDAAGSSRPMLGAAASRVGYWPRATPTGPLHFMNVTKVFRTTTVDGSDAVLVADLSQNGDGRETPSPTANVLAFQTPQVIPGSRISTIDLLTRTVRTSTALGSVPRYSPDGTRIAYVDPSTGALGVMAADLTGARAVTTSGVRYAPSVDWTSDGRWLVAAPELAGSPIELVDVETGASIPLPTTRRYTQPAWKP